MTDDLATAEPPPLDSAGRLAAYGMGACWTWYQVLAAQADRLADSGFVPEGYVFVIALRNLRRAAALVASTFTRDEDQQAAAAALAEFDRALPGSKQTRDIIEHFDDYARGAGALQRQQQRQRDGVEPEPVRFPVAAEVRPASGGGRQLVLCVGEFAVPVADATTAACLLMADMHAASHPDPAYTPAWTRAALCDGAAHGLIPDRLHATDPLPLRDPVIG